MKVLNQLPYSVVWQQCLLSISLSDNSSQKKQTISDINEVLISKLSDVLDNNVTSYKSSLICYQVLSVLRVLSSKRKDEVSVVTFEDDIVSLNLLFKYYKLLLVEGFKTYEAFHYSILWYVMSVYNDDYC